MPCCYGRTATRSHKAFNHRRGVGGVCANDCRVGDRRDAWLRSIVIPLPDGRGSTKHPQSFLMSQPTPTFGQIKAQVAAIRQHKNYANSKAIAIRSKGRWTGAVEQRDGNERFLIHQCDSPLAMRIALRSADENVTRVLITALDDHEIGDDILTRLKPRKLVSLESWQVVKSLFQARTVDPRLSQHSWIADTLMELIPPQGFAPVASGFLDAETVWPILLTHIIGFDAPFADLAAVLKWSIQPSNVTQFRDAAPAFRDAATDWLSNLAGPAAAAVLQCVACQERADALAIGLAAGVLYHRAAVGKLEKATGKFEERYFGGACPEPAVIERWAAAATEVVRLQLSDQRLKQQLLQRGDEILREFGADSFAILSDTSEIGFDLRLVDLGRCLDAAVKSRSLKSYEPLLAARQSLSQHDRSSRERRRLERVDMAMRLVRWLATGDAVAKKPQSLAEAANQHLTEGGFVDWARLKLRTGDLQRELSESYARLFASVTVVREKQALQFAELLRDWTAAKTTDDFLVPVEQVLERIVAPVAAQTAILVIVLDGMSVAVFRELMADTVGHEWMLLAEESIGLRPVLAATPSVTQISRASLLCGRLVQGGQSEERHGFENHPALLKACRNGFPPVLFHKGDIQNLDDGSLAADIRNEIGSPQRKVVGVVVNAIDDHLAKGEQLDIHWTRDEIKVLPVLLHEARSVGRTVILLSDHGHVLDCNATGEPSDGGERWRIGQSEPRDGELRIAGPRVMLPEAKSHIAPWSEKLRYVAKKNGYHGGMSPQEMVIPVAVLSSTNVLPQGWREAPIDQPQWWDLLAVPLSSNAVSQPHLRPAKPKEKPPGRLFDPEGESPATRPATQPVKSQPDWIAALLSSTIFAEQKKLGGRAVPPNEVLTRVLTAIDERGGKITAPALARVLQLPLMRLPGLVAVAQRVLNVDGYPVLNRDDASDTLELNRELLLTQFDLV